MNGRVANAVTAALEALSEKLRPGERVTVEISELCGECRNGLGDLDGGPCPMCGGPSWIERRIVLRKD